ncbi:MAG: hypothetical protein KC621_01840 [Myxococcales bacterium]|nr:hypothetical protein [Myxococcales bacterium]
MHPIDEFLRDLDAAWTPGDRRIPLPLFGSAALFLQTDYARGTKDGDILETQEVAAVRERLLALAGRDSALHRRHRIYLEVVGSGIPFLPPGAEWSPRDLGLSNFDLEVLSVTDVVVTKLKRFHGDDRADVRAMVEGGHVEHARLVRRVRDVVDWFRFDARADQLPRFVANFHTVERDYFGVAETLVELPDDMDR